MAERLAVLRLRALPSPSRVVNRRARAMIMLVEFHRTGDGRLCGWIATPPHRRPFQGSTMAAGRDLPHDLTQFTIERALDIRDGFWGLLAHSGSFASVPGRKPTP